MRDEWSLRRIRVSRRRERPAGRVPRQRRGRAREAAGGGVADRVGEPEEAARHAAVEDRVARDERAARLVGERDRRGRGIGVDLNRSRAHGFAVADIVDRAVPVDHTISQSHDLP